MPSAVANSVARAMDARVRKESPTPVLRPLPAKPAKPKSDPLLSPDVKHALVGVGAVVGGAAAIGIAAYGIKHRKEIKGKDILRLYPLARVGIAASTALGLTWWRATGGRFENFAGSAVRQALDTVALGMPSWTWNARNAYRTEYSDDTRAGAAFGDAASVLLAGGIASAWLKKGAKGVGTSPVTRAVSRVGVGALLAGMVTAGTIKTVHDAYDDGNLGMPMAALGATGGLLYARKHVPGKFTFFKGTMLLAGTVGTGWLGARVGKEIHVGSGFPNPNTAPPSAPELAGALAPLAVLRGAWNHFADDGPLTLGVTFGKSWKQDHAVRERYSTPEVAGGMVGDLGASVLIGAGSLAIGARVLGKSEKALLRSRAATLAQRLRSPSQVVGGMRHIPNIRGTLNGRPTAKVVDMTSAALREAQAGMRIQERLLGLATTFAAKHPRWTTELLYGAGIGLLGWTVREAYATGQNSKRGLLDGPVSAGIVGVGALGTAGLLLAKNTSLAKMSPKARPAMALAMSTVLWSALLFARPPVESFVADARELHKRRDPHPLGAVAFTGAGGVGGYFAGRSIGKLIFGRSHGTAGAVSAAAGAALGAGVGFGFSSIVGTSVPTSEARL